MIRKAMSLLVITLFAPACAVAQPTPQPEVVAPLKLGLIPVLDTLPFYIAEMNGYFEEAGVEVQAVPAASPVERDQLMQAGAIDGMLNELSSTAVFNRTGKQLQIVATARAATKDGPVFRILAAPNSGIVKPGDLAGVPIGISKNTVIEYLTERILEAEGLAAKDIVGESVPAIPERFQLLMEGRLKAATLPDPMASAALQAGATLVIDDSAYPQYSLSVLSFSAKTLETNAEAVRRFMQAWDKAVAELNANPEAYRALFLEKVRVPESVQATYKVPPFPRGQVPSAEQWADVLVWLKAKGLLDADVKYEDSVTTSFLPAK
jgi:NitT/TauT family transport system substrate-binding protein